MAKKKKKRTPKIRGPYAIDPNWATNRKSGLLDKDKKKFKSKRRRKEDKKAVDMEEE